MRVLMMLSLFFLNTTSFSQSLRDSLFSGKLKVDSALLIKSKVSIPKTPVDSIKKSEPDTIKKISADTALNQSGTVKSPVNFKDNGKIWKKFIDQHTGIINAEVLPSKKIRKGSYTVMIDYEIGTDGVVATKNISCSPANEYLTEQIRERMMPDAPLLAPLVRDGMPRKSVKRQVLIFTKDKN